MPAGRPVPARTIDLVTASARDSDELIASLTRALGTGWRAASATSDAMGDRLVDLAHRSITRRVIGVIDERHHSPDPYALVDALHRARPSAAGSVSTTIVPRILRRVGPLSRVARRSPVGLLASAVPGLVLSVTTTLAELEIVAGHLAARARWSGYEPSPDRVAAAAVQALTGAPVAPHEPPPVLRLLRRWITDGARQLLPFGRPVTTDAHAVAARLHGVEPWMLSIMPPAP